MARLICTVEGCGKYRAGHGFCSRHYQRYCRHGDPLAGGTSMGAAQGFIKEACAVVSQQCLDWPFARNKAGYGTARGGLVNRIVCEKAHGSPPTPEHEAAHSCGNRACCNPGHLRWATHAENVADKRMHGTMMAPRGEGHNNAKLTEADIFAIRKLLPDWSRTEIAGMYGVSHRTISAIATGKIWSWL